MMEHDLTQYDLSVILGVSEMTIYRRLRTELPEEEQDRIVEAIEQAKGDNHEEK